MNGTAAKPTTSAATNTDTQKPTAETFPGGKITLEQVSAIKN